MTKTWHDGKWKNHVFPYIKDLARGFRKKPSGPEKLLWEALRNRKIGGLKFRRQFPFGRYIADFYCHEAKLIIEIDGISHEDRDQKNYDECRDQIMKINGLNVMRFKNDEIMNDLDRVLNKIALGIKESKI